MSQREKRGLSRDAAVLAVAAGDEGEVGPGVTSFVSADRSMCAFVPSGSIPVALTPRRGPLPPSPSLAPGLTQPASSAIVGRFTADEEPLASRDSWLSRLLVASMLLGVAHPTRAACG